MDLPDFPAMYTRILWKTQVVGHVAFRFEYYSRITRLYCMDRGGDKLVIFSNWLFNGE